jgi:hypothetical protein
MSRQQGTLSRRCATAARTVGSIEHASPEDWSVLPHIARADCHSARFGCRAAITVESPRNGTELPSGVWFQEPCREMTIFSENYDFTISLLQMENGGGRNYSIEEEEREPDLATLIRENRGVSTASAPPFASLSPVPSKCGHRRGRSEFGPLGIPSICCCSPRA